MEEIYNRHVDTVYRVCFAYMKSASAAEDAVSDTFYRLLKTGKTFQSEDHEKAWLIRVASNVCKNNLRHWSRRNVPADETLIGADDIRIDETFEVVMALPEKTKTVVYLYYYEQYTTPEIAKMLKKPPSTIRWLLAEARKQLKERLSS